MTLEQCLVNRDTTLAFHPRGEHLPVGLDEFRHVHHAEGESVLESLELGSRLVSGLLQFDELLNVIVRDRYGFAGVTGLSSDGGDGSLVCLRITEHLGRLLNLDSIPDFEALVLHLAHVLGVVLNFTLEVGVTLNQHCEEGTADASDFHLPLDLREVVHRDGTPLVDVLPSLALDDDGLAVRVKALCVKGALAPAVLIQPSLRAVMEIRMLFHELLHQQVLDAVTPLHVPFLIGLVRRSDTEFVGVDRECRATVGRVHDDTSLGSSDTLLAPLQPSVSTLCGSVQDFGSESNNVSHDYASSRSESPTLQSSSRMRVDGSTSLLESPWSVTIAYTLPSFLS